jgi:hypothetical protein
MSERELSMRRPILMILLILISSNAIAEWVKVNANDEFSTYANRSTILKKGHVVKMMSMYDYKAVQTHITDSALYMSTQQQGEYDCKQKQSRMLAYSLYYKTMGKGKVTHYKSRPLEWIAVSPMGIDETLLAIACGKTLIPRHQFKTDQRQAENDERLN